MTYTIRKVSEETKNRISQFALEHNLTIGESIGQLVEFGWTYYEQHKKDGKKYQNTLAALHKIPTW